MSARRVADDKHYTHIQNSAVTSWVVNHNLGKIPAITVLDSAGTEVEGQIVHNSVNQSVLSFTTAFAGEAHCN